ncbi:hypothetical protein LF1_24980 [Rubripirellula obstinata]|uniref:DUF2304 domain-containing protein n=1 Tax=Rubripirellula obstinata TaxID=406547 RepID=A0A5B1CK92_9BACT|nr:DUF2304 domain-containing protein [Rubripirellula obstinata]KAA1259960.1 hypothetical protein LF1_24980 [Rubripirellula obstinata]
MTLFQWLVVPLLSFFLVLELMGLRTGRIRPTVRLLRIALWLTAILLTLFPGLSSQLASAVGIGRGVDLVVYLFMIAASVAWLHMQTQHQKLQRSLVELARAEAIRNPFQGGPAADDSTTTNPVVDS